MAKCSVCLLVAISLKVTVSTTPNIQHSFTPFPLCLLPSELGRADVGLCTCVRACVCVSATPLRYPSTPSYASLVFPVLPSFLSSPQEQTSSILKRPSLRGPPHPTGQVSVWAHAPNYTTPFVCSYVEYMQVCLSILQGVTRGNLFYNQTVALCTAQSWTETPTVGSLPVVGSKTTPREKTNNTV